MDLNENNFVQGHYSGSGVVLKRVISPKGDIFLDLFLKGMGIIWVIAPGSAKGKVRFGGAIEPSSWGIFTLYKGARNFYLPSCTVLMIAVDLLPWWVRWAAGKP